MSSKKEPYVGSVLFFKHMILATLVLMIVVPTTLSIFFGVRSSKLSGQVDSMADTISSQSDTIHNLQSNALDTTLNSVATEVFAAEIDAEPQFQIETPAYQSLYPDMCCDTPLNQQSAVDPTLYLTFDDGPSAVTTDILNTLDSYDVQATFFVQGSALESETTRTILNEIADAGHSIGIHTYSHDYRKIYSSVDAFLDDFYAAWSLVKEITGTETFIFRFPGGSINNYNASVYQEIISEMLRRGFVYYDWNASSTDAASSAPTAKNVIVTASTDTRNYSRIVLLMHDSIRKTTTAEALPEVIDWYLDAGYHIAPLTRDVVPIVYAYR